LIGVSTLDCAAAIRADPLATSFRVPPASARPHTWWHWMNGRITREGITADLEWMQRVGIGGVQAFHIADGFEPGPVGYLSPEWLQIFEHAASESNRLGLEMCLHNCAGWSSSGGPWITPELAMQEVVWTQQRIDATPQTTIQLERPKAKHDYYRDIAVVAFRTPPAEVAGHVTRLRNWKAKAGFERKNRPTRDTRKLDADQVIARDAIVDLTDRMDADGTLDWTPPAGEWTILRIGHTPTGQTNLPAPAEGLGLECDKLNPEAAELHWQHVVEPVRAQLGPLAGKTMRSVLIDSYEARHQNWTPGFDAEFSRRMGYDLQVWLPALTGRVVDSAELTERFLWDFRHVIGELVAENYYGKFEQLCHDHGLQLAVEPYGYWGVFNDFEMARYGDLPMGEFWTDRPTTWSVPTTKFAASAAHAFGRNVVAAESFTSGLGSAGWLNYPARLKTLGDHFYCQGLNRVIFHTCVHQPWLHNRPGMTMWRWGMQMNRNNTLAERLGPWLTYMARTQFLLQQGEFVADLCYLADEDTPNSSVTRSALLPAPPNGYDYDHVAASVLHTMEVRDGHIVLLSGMRYRALVLPANASLRPELLQEAIRLANAGATVVAATPPKAAPGLQNFPACDDRVRRLADELWNNERFIEADLVDELSATLKNLGVNPDFACKGVELGSDLEYIHRRTAAADIYFVSNQRGIRVHARPIFRVANRVPELWNPETGETSATPVWRSLGSRGTEVDLQLEPAEAVFVVFRRAAPAENRISALEVETPLEAHADLFTISIDEAIYGRLGGTESERADVTPLVRDFARDGRCRVPVTNYLAKDPAPKFLKHLVVRYRIDGEPYEDVVRENDWWTLDVGPTFGPPPAAVETTEQGATLVSYQPGRHAMLQSDGSRQLMDVPLPPAPLEVAGPWSVAFADLAGNQQFSFPKLVSWSRHAEETVRHYSGTATYRATFHLSADQFADGLRHWLELGDVEVLAELRINGGDSIPLWKRPFAAEVSRWTKSGFNEVEVSVTNLWANRLIGDERFSADFPIDQNGSMSHVPDWLEQDRPRPSRDRKAVATFKHWSVDDELLPSGLLGPVRLYFGHAIPISTQSDNHPDAQSGEP
jgi:hypothetical protein